MQTGAGDEVRFAATGFAKNEKTAAGAQAADGFHFREQEAEDLSADGGDIGLGIGPGIRVDGIAERVNDAGR